MEQSDIGNHHTHQPPTAQIRHWQLPSRFHDPCLVIGHFALSLVLGGIGGSLMGATALLVLQSLEILADNRLLMDQLENYITDADYFLEREAKKILQWESYNEVHDIHISLFAQLFGIFCIVVSSVFGLLFGYAAYYYMIKTSGEASSKKAMTRAVPVLLFFTTAIGCALGMSLEGFLSLTVNVYFSVWIIISILAFVPPTVAENLIEPQSLMDSLTVALMLQPGASFFAFLSTFWSRSRVTLGFSLTVPFIFESVSSVSKPFAVIVPLMLIISDIFNIAGQPIAAIDSPTCTNTTNIVVESIFIGILTSQLLMAGIGMALYEIWQMGGAYKVCGSAAAFGSTVWGIMKGALNGMGPGPIIGGLMGVAGAVGVSLSAAVVAAEKPVPRLGVMVGAAAGASMSSLGHSGLSRVFMGLCAATIPATKILLPQRYGGFVHKPLHLPKPIKYVCFSIFLSVPIIITSYTYTSIYFISLMKFRIFCAYDLGFKCLILLLPILLFIYR